MTTHLVSPIEFDGTDVAVTGAAYHHLFRVKRLATGDEVRIVDGEGRARRSVVARVDRARAVLALGAAEPSRESARAVELLVAPARAERASWLVEKATELGVAAVRFVVTERSARDARAFGPGVVLRLQRVAAAALEQCGRSRLPAISGPHELGEALGVVAGAADGARFVLDPGGRPAAALRGEGAGRASVLVGPEGGFAAAELERFEALGFERIALGGRILRIETAALAAAALLLCGAEERP